MTEKDDLESSRGDDARLRCMSKVFMDAADPILIEDLDGRVTEMNSEAERAYGWRREDLLGQPIRTLVPESRHEQANKLLKQCTSGESVRNVEGLRQNIRGEVVPVLITLSLLRDEDGQPIGIASLCKDISEQKAAEKELLRYREHLEELVAKLEVSNTQMEEAEQAAVDANKAKSAFLANMSHELRTPLNAIIGYSEMLQEEAEDLALDSFAPDLQKIHGAGRHLLALINDVLDLSKIEAGKMDLFLESFDLDELLDDVVSTVDSLIQKKRNVLVVDRQEELGRVRNDLTKVRQMLFNLISNAAKFTEDGRITLAVACETDENGNWVTFCIRDTGIGIPPDKIGKLFDEFSQVEESTTRNYGGTGLGLAITKRFCEMMGGTITVESTAGEGSAFTIRTPVEVLERVE